MSEQSIPISNSLHSLEKGGFEGNGDLLHWEALPVICVEVGSSAVQGSGNCGLNIMRGSTMQLDTTNAAQKMGEDL